MSLIMNITFIKAGKARLQPNAWKNKQSGIHAIRLLQIHFMT